MLKNDYLLSQDIVGKQNYLTADGNISEGTVINLRNLNFGGLDLVTLTIYNQPNNIISCTFG